jgi:hypothetical protein
MQLYRRLRSAGPPAKLRPTARQVLFLQVLLDEVGAQVNVDLYQR